MFHYRMMRSINGGYPLVVLGLYITAFILALCLMFIFPPGTLLLLGFGLAGLVGVLIVGRTLGAMEHFIARTILRGGACPSCGHRMQTSRDEADVWQCEACDAVFRPDGAQKERAAA